MQIQKTPHFTLKSSSRRKENIIENKTSFRSDIYIFEKLLQIIRSCLGTAMNGTQPTVFKWRYPFVQFEFTQNQFLLKRCSDKTTLIISGDFSCWGIFQYTLGAPLLGGFFVWVKLLSLRLQFRSGTSFWVFEALAVIPDSDLVAPGSGSIPPITFIEIDKIPQRQSWSPSSSFSSSPPSSQRSQNQLKQQGFVTRLYVYSFSGLLGGKSVSPFFPEVS